MLSITEEVEGKSLDPIVKQKLDVEIANLYRAAKLRNESEKDPSVE